MASLPHLFWPFARSFLSVSSPESSSSQTDAMCSKAIGIIPGGPRSRLLVMSQAGMGSKVSPSRLERWAPGYLWNSTLPKDNTIGSKDHSREHCLHVEWIKYTSDTYFIEYAQQLLLGKFGKQSTGSIFLS